MCSSSHFAAVDVVAQSRRLPPEWEELIGVGDVFSETLHGSDRSLVVNRDLQISTIFSLVNQPKRFFRMVKSDPALSLSG